MDDAAARSAFRRAKGQHLARVGQAYSIWYNRGPAIANLDSLYASASNPDFKPRRRSLMHTDELAEILAASNEPALSEAIEHDTSATLQSLATILKLQHPKMAKQAHEAICRAHVRASQFINLHLQASAAAHEFPDASLFAYYQALALFLLGHAEQAIEYVERRFEREADIPKGLHFYLAAAYYRLGNSEKAEAMLEPIAEKDRNFTRRIVAWALLDGQRKDAGRHTDANKAVLKLQEHYEAKPLTTSSSLHNWLQSLDFAAWSSLKDKSGFARFLRTFDSAEPSARMAPEALFLPQERTLLEARLSDGEIWIIKPTHLFGGQGIHVTNSLTHVPPDQTAIAQQYIAEPYLIDGRKGHIRLYILFTCFAPVRAYVYADGPVRIAPEKYVEGDGWLDNAAMHITNTALHVGHPELKISDSTEREDEGNVWSLRAVLDLIERERGAGDNAWQSLRSLATKFVQHLDVSGFLATNSLGFSRYSFPCKLIGLDVLFDRDLRPWILEFQRAPAPSGSALVKKINGEMFRTIFEMTRFRVQDDDLNLRFSGSLEEWSIDHEMRFAGKFDRLAL